MEELFSYIYSKDNNDLLHRHLSVSSDGAFNNNMNTNNNINVAGGGALATTVSASALSQQASITSLRWKTALWAKDSVEPAMLRVPIVVIVFIVLWGINVWLFERARLPYHNVLLIKSGENFFFI